ncbi:hypothetical protein MASR1M66_15640 [Aminivibrio sp.]
MDIYIQAIGTMHEIMGWASREGISSCAPRELVMLYLAIGRS